MTLSQLPGAYRHFRPLYSSLEHRVYIACLAQTKKQCFASKEYRLLGLSVASYFLGSQGEN